MQLKRFVIACLVVILTVSAMALTIAAADTDPLKVAVEVDTSTAILNQPLTVQPGDEISVKVRITQNPGLRSFEFSLLYDPEILTLKNVVDEENRVQGFGSDHLFDVEAVQDQVYKDLTDDYDVEMRELWFSTIANNTISSGVSEKTGLLFEVTFVVTKECSADELVNIEYIFNSESTTDKNWFPIKNVEVTADDGFYIHNPGEAADCTNPQTCTGCDFVFNDALGHTEEEIPAVAPTCTETGLTAGVKCSVCGEILTVQKEVAALGHTEEEIPAVAPTCTKTGLTAGVK